MSRRSAHALLLPAALLLLSPPAARAGFVVSRPAVEGPVEAYDPGCPALQPEIRSAQVTTPAPGAVLAKQDIRYVSGNAVDIKLTTSTCSDVTEVRYGGLLVPTDADDIEGSSRTYEVLSRQTVTIKGVGTVQIITLRLHFQNLGRGTSAEVAVTVGARVGGLSATTRFTLAQVLDVKGILDFSITEAELANAFVQGLYETFGDDNAQYTVLADDSLRRDAYALDYGEDLELSVAEDGIRVSMAFKADIPNWCDPTVHLWGRFTVDKDSSGVFVAWLDGPHADFDFPFYCDAVLYTVGLVMQAGIWYIMEPSAANKFGEMIEARIAGSFPEDEARYAIESVSVTDGAVVAIVNPPYASVTVDVPYDDVPVSDPSFYGMAVPPGERLAIIPGGLVEACTSTTADLPQDCDSEPVAATGLFNWSGNAPVPDPWELVGSQWVYRQARADARARLTGLYRDAALLPVPGRNVGALLARGGDLVAKGNLNLVGAPCAVVAPASQPDWRPAIAFAVNDHRAMGNRIFGSGSFRVSIGMAKTVAEGDMIAEIGACPSFAPATRSAPLPEMPGSALPAPEPAPLAAASR